MAQKTKRTTGYETFSAASYFREGASGRNYVVGEDRPLHRHALTQLLYAPQGVMLVKTEKEQRIIAPMQALWIPAQLPHAIAFLTDTRMRSLYFDARVEIKPMSDSLRVITVTPLIRELMAAIFSDDTPDALRSPMQSLVIALTSTAPELPRRLTMPKDSKLRRELDRLLSDGAWHRTAGELARTLNLTERTFSRRFEQETGMTFRTWKASARLFTSLDLISSGWSIKRIALRLGFCDAATFSTQFKAFFGVSPRQFAREAVDTDGT